MYILFSPSEEKYSNQDYGKKASNSIQENHKNIIFEHLYDKRAKVLKLYQSIVLSNDEQQITKLFGIKDINKCKMYINDIFCAPTTKAICLYSGVAYKALDYMSLDTKAKNSLDNKVIIFSNLFGPIRAKDNIPLYKLKQGEKLGTFNIEAFYKEYFSASLDKLFEGHWMLDLRAEHYCKFYTIKSKYISASFLKNGKKVSHFAKYYRGILLREVIRNSAYDLSSIKNVDIQNLELIDEVEYSKKIEFVYNISS